MTATDAPPANDRTISHFMKGSVVAALLREEHGDAKARMIALQEQRKARQARSRRRFTFWVEVATRIESGTDDAGVR